MPRGGIPLGIAFRFVHETHVGAMRVRRTPGHKIRKAVFELQLFGVVHRPSKTQLFARAVRMGENMVIFGGSIGLFKIRALNMESSDPVTSGHLALPAVLLYALSPASFVHNRRLPF